MSVNNKKQVYLMTGCQRVERHIDGMPSLRPWLSSWVRLKDKLQGIERLAPDLSLEHYVQTSFSEKSIKSEAEFISWLIAMPINDAAIKDVETEKCWKISLQSINQFLETAKKPILVGNSNATDNHTEMLIFLISTMGFNATLSIN